MKFTSALAALSFAATAMASPLLFERAGPAGQLKTPNGNTNVRDIDGLEVQFTRVNGDQGFYTETIDLYLVDLSSNTNHTLVTGLTSKSKADTIDSWFQIPEPTGDVPVNNEVQYQLFVFENQIGEQGPIRFQSGAPTFTVTLVGGDQCAGSPNGNCGNTQ